MRLDRQIRITEISKEKQSSFLKSLSFPISLVIDVDRFVKLYFIIHSNSVLFAEKKLDERFKIFIESFSSEYNFRFIEENLSEFQGQSFYTCTYSDQGLKSFIETLLLNRIRARVILTLKPKTYGWLSSFAVASTQNIEHISISHFSNIAKINSKQFQNILQGKTINPRLLKQLTIPRFSGIDEIPQTKIDVPSKYTLTENQSFISIGKIIHPITKDEIVDATLPIQRINQHVGILATTGAGKTNLCHQIILELHKKNIPCLIFDWKRDYRGLYKKISAKVYDFRDNLFTFNPVKPSGEPSQWIKELANIMSEIISGGYYASGSFSIYVEILDRLYKDRGIYDGATDYPTIFDLLTELESYSQGDLSDRQKNWVASAMKLLKSLAIGKTKQAFNVKEGLNLDQLLNETIVIELDGLGDPKTKAFFISVLLQKIRNYRLQKTERDILKHVIVVEEAQNILTKNQEASSIITTTYREIRSLCEGIICITQIPSELSKDALANTNTFLVLKLIHRDDKLVACNLLNISPNDMKIIEDLDVGIGLMKTDEMCLTRIPLIEKEVVNDSDIKIEKPEREEVSTSFPRRKDIENRASDLTSKEWLVLKHIAESTAYNNTTLLRITKYSNAEISSIMKTLIDKGFVRYKKVKKRGVGRKQNIFFLFPYGEEAYRQKFGRYPERSRIELVEKYNHGEMKHKIIECSGLAVKNPGRFDILLEDDTAIEIETGTNRNEQIYKNIQKSIEAFGIANFIAPEQRVYFAVLQQAAKHCYDARDSFILNIALFDKFVEKGEWEVFGFA